MTKRIYIVLSFLLFIHCNAGEISWQSDGENGFSASAIFSKDTLTLLDQLNVQLTLVYPESYHPNIDEIRMHLFQNLGMDASPFTPESERSEVPDKLKDGLLTQTLTFVLVPQRTGTHALTFFGIPFEPTQPSSGPRVVIMSGIAMIKVDSPPELFDPTIYEPSLMALSPLFPINISPSNKAQTYFTIEKKKQEAKRNLRIFREKTIPWLSIGILTFAVLFAILFIKTKEVIPNPFTAKQVSPKSKALRELKRIKKQKDTDYQQLTTVLSQFIEDRYNVKTRSKTSAEFIAEISSLPLLPKMQTPLKEFFYRADQIKFGLFEISSEQIQKDFQFIQDLINNT